MSKEGHSFIAPINIAVQSFNLKFLEKSMLDGTDFDFSTILDIKICIGGGETVIKTAEA